MLPLILDANLLQSAGSNQVYLEASPLQKSLQTSLTVNSVPVPSSQQVLTVNSTADTVDPNDGKLTLREAIDLANATPGAAAINFDLESAAQTLTLTGGQLNIQDTLIISGSSNLTINGNGRSRIFEISRDASVTLSKLKLMNGSAISGGAISNAGTINLVDITFSGNRSPLGGALANVGSAYLTNVTLNANNAASGGGIHNGGYLSITNSTFSGNSASADGGGLYSDRGSVEIQSSTFTLNLADSDNDGSGNGGGIRINSGTIAVQNTIVANNFDTPNNNGNGIRQVDVSGNFTDLGSNLIGDSTGSTGWTVRSRVGTNTQRIDPRLLPLSNNGGLTQTHALRSDSPALNASNSGPAPMTDQRGIQRTAADIGAYEAALTNLTVDLLVDESDANISAGDVSLREALQYVADGGAINFAPDLRGTIMLQLGGLLIDRSVSINGSGAEKLTVRGDWLPSVFSIAQNITADINNLTVINQYVDGRTGISNAGNLTLSSLTIRDTDGAFGSAIKNQSKATLNLYRSSLINNGGLAVVMNFGTMTIQNSTISNNAAREGIYNEGTLAINASTIAASSQMGIRNATSTEAQGVVKVKNTIIANNPIDVFGVFISEGHNLIGNGSDARGFVHGQNGDQVGTKEALINPKFDKLKDNGSSIWTRALLPGSPALNAANPYDRPQTDQRGVDRGSRPDIGAYENVAVIARSDSATVRRGGSVTIPVLANDFDADGDSFTIVNYSNPRGGSLTRNADGTFTYTSRFPLLNDIFTYIISDGKGETSTATVQIRIV